MGGETVKKSITVRTSDPNANNMTLTISGRVKPVAEFSTKVIRLTGTGDQAVSAMVTITPAEENPFKIIGVSADSGDNITYTLEEKKQNRINIVFTNCASPIKKWRKAGIGIS
jgi:hypothetical protein